MLAVIGRVVNEQPEYVVLEVEKRRKVCVRRWEIQGWKVL